MKYKNYKRSSSQVKMSDLTARVKYLEQENRRLRGVLEKIIEVASAPPLEQPKPHEKQRHTSGHLQFWREDDGYYRDITKELAFDKDQTGGLNWDFSKMDVPGNND